MIFQPEPAHISLVGKQLRHVSFQPLGGSKSHALHAFPTTEEEQVGLYTEAGTGFTIKPSNLSTCTCQRGL